MAAFVSSFTGLRLGTPTGASVAPQFKGEFRIWTDFTLKEGGERGCVWEVALF